MRVNCAAVAASLFAGAGTDSKAKPEQVGLKPVATLTAAREATSRRRLRTPASNRGDSFTDMVKKSADEGAASASLELPRTEKTAACLLERFNLNCSRCGKVERA